MWEGTALYARGYSDINEKCILRRYSIREETNYVNNESPAFSAAAKIKSTMVWKSVPVDVVGDCLLCHNRYDRVVWKALY